MQTTLREIDYDGCITPRDATGSARFYASYIAVRDATYITRVHTVGTV